MRRFRKKTKGVSLVELIIAIGIFALVVGSVGMFSIDALRANENARRRIEAAAYMQEMTNALIAIKSDNWASIINNTGGNKKIVFQNNKYQLADGVDTINGYSIAINVGSVNRDASGNIVSSGGTLDARTRSINISVTWNDFLNISQSVSSVLYLNSWSTYTWKQSSKTDFDSGTFNQTISKQVADGEVELNGIAYPDWCKPSLALSSLDLPGSAVATSVKAIPGQAFVGTGSSNTTIDFMNISISNTQPPIATVKNTNTGVKANDVFGEANYAYLTTDSDTSEVIILDTSGTNPTQVGSFDAPGTANGISVFVVNNKGYLTTSDNKFYIFDLSFKTGSRLLLGQKTLMGQGSEVQLVGNYAYISLTNGSHVELQILNITDPNNLFTVGLGNTSQQDASDLFINSTGTRAYVGTANSSTEKEFITFDTSNKATLQNQEYFQESGGSVSIEAEHFHSNITRNGKSWVNQTNGSPSGASGTYMYATPDTGTSISTDYFNTSPELGYKVNFTTTGTYYFWVRAYPENSSNNNVHGGYDGANYPNVESISSTSYNGWRWFRGSIDITTAEMHWINIWMQDDGFRLDKIYLTTNSSYTPTSTGPVESTRTTSDTIVPQINRQIAQYDTAGMSITGVTVVEDEAKAILVGTGGQEYQVLDVSNETAPTKCGGLDVNSGIKSISSVKEADNDSYSYIITGETASEFRIIRGGPGAGNGGSDTLYPTSGTYTSPVYDTGSTSTVYLNFKPTFKLGVSNTNLRFQVRTGDSAGEISTNSWLGPDSTSSSYFTTNSGEFIPVTTQGKRYIQYNAYYTSDSSYTATLEQMEIDYQK